jgi:lactonase
VTPIIQNISVANGIALSTDEKVLWGCIVTPSSSSAMRCNRLAVVSVTHSTFSSVLKAIPLAQPFGATIPYYFTGHEGPDSCCIDRDDNLYVAMYGQGRVNICPIG